MKKLTDKQLNTFAFMLAYLQEHHSWPTLRYMAKEHGVSLKAMADRVMEIEKKGHLIKSKGTYGYKAANYEMKLKRIIT